jgi:cyclin-dependent kinase 7
VAIQRHPRPPLRQLFTAASDDALDLMERMLAYDPRRRTTAREALAHAYFQSQPRPTPPERLPRVGPRAGSTARTQGMEPRVLFPPQ